VNEDSSSGHVRAVVAKKDGQNKMLTGRQLIGIIRQACKAKTTVISDEFPGYRILDKHKASKALCAASKSSGIVSGLYSHARFFPDSK
jgi:hypothetical protein